jgi:hypothetical protein
MGLVYGVGLYEGGEYSCAIGGKRTQEYSLWTNMLNRCYSSKYHDITPTYIGCSVSENFKNFQYFAEWCNKQIGFKETNYQLDKDIVSKGNKLYSEDTCFFVPRELNMFLTNSNASRGTRPVGVSFNKPVNKYVAYCKDGYGFQKHLGYFQNEIEAFQVYKTYKEALAKQLAKEYEGLVHPKVIEALNNYVVEITD